MATTVKLVKDFGLEGRIVHKHGDSGWHPAHRSHGSTRGYGDDAHEVHEAAKPTNGADVLKTKALQDAYVRCLEGVEQPEFLAKWNEYKAKQKAKRAEAKANEPVAAS